jgi:hypothetical protein
MASCISPAALAALDVILLHLVLLLQLPSLLLLQLPSPLLLLQLPSALVLGGLPDEDLLPL